MNYTFRNALDDEAESLGWVATPADKPANGDPARSAYENAKLDLQKEYKDAITRSAGGGAFTAGDIQGTIQAMAIQALLQLRANAWTRWRMYRNTASSIVGGKPDFS